MVSFFSVPKNVSSGQLQNLTYRNIICHKFKTTHPEYNRNLINIKIYAVNYLNEIAKSFKIKRFRDFRNCF